jgi:hypothetical protein
VSCQILSKSDHGIRMCFAVYNVLGALCSGWQKKQLIVKCNPGQPDDSNLINGIIIWFAVRIQSTEEGGKGGECDSNNLQ